MKEWRVCACSSRQMEVMKNEETQTIKWFKEKFDEKHKNSDSMWMFIGYVKINFFNWSFIAGHIFYHVSFFSAVTSNRTLLIGFFFSDVCSPCVGDVFMFVLFSHPTLFIVVSLSKAEKEERIAHSTG